MFPVTHDKPFFQSVRPCLEAHAGASALVLESPHSGSCQAGQAFEIDQFLHCSHETYTTNDFTALYNVLIVGDCTPLHCNV